MKSLACILAFFFLTLVSQTTLANPFPLQAIERVLNLSSYVSGRSGLWKVQFQNGSKGPVLSFIRRMADQKDIKLNFIVKQSLDKTPGNGRIFDVVVGGADDTPMDRALMAGRLDEAMQRAEIEVLDFGFTMNRDNQLVAKARVKNAEDLQKLMKETDYLAIEADVRGPSDFQRFLYL